MNRIKAVNLLIIAMFLFLGFGLLNLEVIQGEKFRDLSRKNCIRLLPQKGARGKILDTHGSVIVDNRLSYDVMILPQESAGLNQALESVSSVLGVSPRDLKDVFRKGYIAPSVPIVVAKNISIKKAIALEGVKTEVTGLIIHPNPVRNYPYAGLAAHVIGYVNEIDRWRLTKLADYGYKTKDIVGFGGLEEKYDYFLRQEEGGLSFEVDHRGRFVRLLGFQGPRNGTDIQLTLNLKIQKIVEEQLQGLKGCVVLMDPYSGEIAAMTSSPGFSPGIFVDKESTSIRRLFKNPDAPLVNRAISGAYPAGSMFKIIVAAAALETKKVTAYTSFLCEGSILIGGQDFACWSKHGEQSLEGAIARSCNVFFYRTGLLVGAQSLHDYAVKFGFSRPVGFELPYEAGGFIPSPLWRKINKFQKWFDGDTANLSIGQGDVSVTPLQMARLVAVFANKGNLVTPYLVKAIGARDISLRQRKSVHLNIKDATIDYIRQGLRQVVLSPEGTGNVLSGLSISVAGKTGTAQAPPGQPHAWFAGFFPYKNPKFVICVFLEHGGPGYYSCVVAKQIIEEMINQGLI